MSVTLHTSKGDIKVELACEEVPRLCFNFLALAASGYYDNVTFHRNMPGFIVQAGNPSLGAQKVNGKYEYVALPERGPKGGESIWGGKFEDSFHPSLRHNRRGVLSMANKGANTNGSQFFFTYAAQPSLDDAYCVFGTVKEGLGVLDALETVPTDPKKNRPLEPVVIERVTIHANPLALSQIVRFQT
ncbi:Peptidyl-prolyl cis-trans isomerase-like 3 [Hondaea fermentalgiana]|uniref:Peptidyl-prolyl cis-trans isomerase n=1 Tax=Hondaea fermentalgiana TaxID=2315210 RepID=A0A2R5G8B7_9STRA|nr:Peptidyl-prolyl cis-trans isomerase-like 3 [Hondaea fermentalgiana]|eukprot:GBG27302.1 Peptidyl-prolyl cis-trans isomerase-like 3 [Hondaea fermentalgiana]